MSTPPRAAELGLIMCHSCDLTLRDHQTGSTEGLVCPRCGDAVHRRKSNSLTRTWAYLIAAAALYLPANFLVMMRTSEFPTMRSDTILSGVIQLYIQGDKAVAIIVFTASIFVPLMKMLALALLLITSMRASDWHPRERTKLFRFIEFIGHWSMLDVFVVALLITLVQFGPHGRVDAGPAIIPFGGVVILTMLSSLSFDPRLIWDRRPARVSTVERDR